MKSIKLIDLYYYVCECYERELCWHCQRFSNNFAQNITDEELLTIYLYSLMYENKRKLSEVHDYAKTKQKFAGCFRSPECADRYARIQGFISTCRKHQINVFNELRAVCSTKDLYVAPFGC